MKIEQLIKRTTDVFLSQECLEKTFDSLINYNYDLKNLKLKNHREPIDTGFDANEIIDIRISIVREMLKTIILDGINYDVFKNIIKEYDVDLNLLDINKADIINLLKLNDSQLYNMCSSKGNKLNTLLNYIYYKCANFGLEHNGRDPIYPVQKQSNDRKYISKLSITNAYTKRIYLNLPEGINKYKFLGLYIKKCIQKRIPFEIKGIVPDAGLDRTVLYSNDYYLCKQIEIIDEIIKNNKDIANSIGTPIAYGGRVINDDGNSCYAISSGVPSLLRKQTQSDFIDITVTKAFLPLCAKVLIKYGKFGNSPRFNIIDLNKIANLENLSVPEIVNWILLHKPSVIDNSETSNALREDLYNLEAYGIEAIKQLLSKDESVKRVLIEIFKNNIKIIASVSRFNDKAHLEVPMYMDDGFLKLINKSNVSSKEENEQQENNEKYLYLYETESLFENAIEEFENSDLSKFERTKKYVEKIDMIRKKYSHYIAHTNGFAGSERFKVVYEYMKTIPMYKLYKYDSNSGNYVNKVKEQEYYEGIYNELVDFLGELGKSNSI